MVFPTCQIAFKEWGAICLALAIGKQTIILRKGGIHEGRGGFQMDHAQFWLYPTRFHESAEHLSQDAKEFVEQAAITAPAKGLVGIQHMALVTDVIRVDSMSAVARIASKHLWSNATVESRFNYRQPGLTVMIVRCFKHGGPPHVIQENPEMAGCKSWVTLPTSLPFADLDPVMSEAEFCAERDEILQVLNAR